MARFFNPPQLFAERVLEMITLWSTRQAGRRLRVCVWRRVVDHVAVNMKMIVVDLEYDQLPRIRGVLWVWGEGLGILALLVV